MKEVTLVILDVRSAHNVGSMFRTADAAGVSRIYCVGYTPAPLDKFKRPQKEIAKTALGAEHSIPWEHHADIHVVCETLRREGFVCVALEQSDQSIDYRAIPRNKGKIALIVGNEVEGIPGPVLHACEYVIEIPMHGSKESLNVSVATGIALYALQS